MQLLAKQGNNKWRKMGCMQPIDKPLKGLSVLSLKQARVYTRLIGLHTRLIGHSGCTSGILFRLLADYSVAGIVMYFLGCVASVGTADSEYSVSDSIFSPLYNCYSVYLFLYLNSCRNICLLKTLPMTCSAYICTSGVT